MFNILLKKIIDVNTFNFLSPFWACWVKEVSSQVKE